MGSLLRQFLRISTACMLVTVFAVPQSLVAQAQVHLVSPGDLQQQLLAAGRTRQHNLATVQRFLSTNAAEKAMASLHADARQVTSAVSSLSDAELANLAARANQAQTDFAAGNINDHDLLIILIAVLVLILIIVAVKH